MSGLSILQASDLHFGRDADLEQIAGLERLAMQLQPGAIVIAGDLSQRARHGEFQRALALVQTLGRLAPILVIPGNHDVQWWASPFDILGTRAKYAKYRRYFGEDLHPSLRVEGAIFAGVLSSHGVVAGSMTWNLNDMAVKGHLPRSETERAAALYRAESPETLRVMVMHQNLMRGNISRRMGLAHWQRSWREVIAAGTDLVLCGHDHEEAAGLLPNGTVVSTSGTHTSRTRGGRPSACNLVRVQADQIKVQHYIWDSAGSFQAGPERSFPWLRMINRNQHD